MRNIEKALTSYVRGNGPKPKNEVLVSLADKDANSLINILFHVINEEIENLNGPTSLERIRELLKYIYVVLGTAQDINRKAVSRRLNKLYERVDRIQTERRSVLNPEQTKKGFKKIQDEIDELQEQTEKKETKRYDFIRYLIEEIHNLHYIEYTFVKIPNLVNVRDKDNHSAFYNTVLRYLEMIQEEQMEECLYYSNVISLFLSDPHFFLPENEKRSLLDMIYNRIDHMNVSKEKGSKAALKDLEELVECIKTESESSRRIETIAKKYGISIAFPQPILEQIQFQKNPYEVDPTRRLVADYIITIDKEGAVEIDDALSCVKLPNGNYLLGVHKASVLGYFPYHSPVVEEALKRTSSIYLHKRYQRKEDDFNRIIPMFPYDFSANRGSLLAGVPRLARSYYFEIAKDGTIVQETFFKSIIVSSKKTSYREIDRVLENGSSDERLQELVTNLSEVTEILDKVYQPSPLYEQIKENVDDYADLRVKRTGAEKIVNLAMLLTGNHVANYFASSERGFPCMYRVLSVDEEDSRKLQAMIDNLTKTYGGEQYQKLYQLVHGIYPKGWYSLTGRHDGLGVAHHCHCTSTLRRAADVVMEHAEETCIDQNPTDKELARLEAEIEKRAAQINAKQDSIEWFVRDYKKAMQKRR